ncbi:MAG: glycoside hydrolase family 88 protein [Planctomycetota bacterium]
MSMGDEEDLRCCARRAADVAERLRGRFAEREPTWGAYHLEMTLEALCAWAQQADAHAWLAPVQALWARRGWPAGHAIPWRSQPFASHDDELARATGDAAIRASFIAQTAAMESDVPRDIAGLVLHGHPELPCDRQPLIIDYMHEFAARLASAAALGGDPSWWDQACDQLFGYRDILRDPATGLWHLGRDWGRHPGSLSPGAWSRGHGWLLRGLTAVLHHMPATHPRRAALTDMLVDCLVHLRDRQDAEGMWHVLLHRPHAESPPETSGTALIGWSIARAIHDGLIDAAAWTEVARQAIDAVCDRVDAAGVVHGACRGPGLLFDDGEELYRGRPIAPDDPHGAPCALFACLGAQLLAAGTVSP